MELDAKIVNVRKKRDAIEMKIRKLMAKRVDLTIDGALRKNEEYRRLAKEHARIRKSLHRDRVNLTRKRFSVASHHRHIDRLNRLLAKFSLSEQEGSAKQSAAEKRMREIEQTIRQELIAKNALS